MGLTLGTGSASKSVSMVKYIPSVSSAPWFGGIKQFQSAYYNGNNVNQLLKVVQPNVYCPQYTNNLYPEMTRYDLEVSHSPAYLAQNNNGLCLGNEGVTYVSAKHTWGSHYTGYGLGYLELDTSKSGYNVMQAAYGGIHCMYDTSVGRAIVCLSEETVGSGSDFETFTTAWATHNNLVSAHHASRDSFVEQYSDSLVPDVPSFTFKVPEWGSTSALTPPDEYGRGRSTGGESYICTSVDILLRVYASNQSAYFTPAIVLGAEDNSQNLVPSYTMGQLTGSMTNTFSTFSVTTSGEGYRDLLIKGVRAQFGSTPTTYTHVYPPFLVIKPETSNVKYTFLIMDYRFNVRFYDSVCSNPT